MVQNRLVEVTTRTFQGRYLLRPSSDVNRTILGVLGRAQRRTGIELCGFTFLSNHYHLLAVPESTEQLSEFMGFVNGNIARKVGRLHDWHGKLWDRRYQHIIVSDEPEAQVGRLRYLLSQGVKEGLVRNPEDWPGVHCVGQLLRGYAEVTGGIWRDQTAEYRARRIGRVLSPEEFLFRESVWLRPIPCWAELVRRDRCGRVEEILREIARMAHERREKTEKAPLGARKIMMQVPEWRPKPMRRSPAPAYHAVSREHHERHRERYGEFLGLHRHAAQGLKEGRPDVVFPPGCFPPRLPYVPETRAGPRWSSSAGD